MIEHEWAAGSRDHLSDDARGPTVLLVQPSVAGLCTGQMDRQIRGQIFLIYIKVATRS